MGSCQIGSHLLQKQKKHGKPRLSFTKDPIPDDKGSEKYKMMVNFLKEFSISVEYYHNCLESESQTSIVTTNSTYSTNTEITSSNNDESSLATDSISTNNN